MVHESHMEYATRVPRELVQLAIENRMLLCVGSSLWERTVLVEHHRTFATGNPASTEEACVLDESTCISDIAMNVNHDTVFMVCDAH